MLGVLGFFADLARVLKVLPRVEASRRRQSVHGAVGLARRNAALRVTRSPDGRRRLRRAIFVADALVPGGRNCVRRSLLEIALDSGAANERVLAGFLAGGGRKSGHAWLESNPSGRSFDAVITI